MPPGTKTWCPPPVAGSAGTAVGCKSNPNPPGPHALRGFALAELGRRAEVLREAGWLELPLSPDFDSIQNDPRYLALLRKYANPGT